MVLVRVLCQPFSSSRPAPSESSGNVVSAEGVPGFWGLCPEEIPQLELLWNLAVLGGNACSVPSPGGAGGDSREDPVSSAEQGEELFTLSKVLHCCSSTFSSHSWEHHDAKSTGSALRSARKCCVLLFLWFTGTDPLTQPDANFHTALPICCPCSAAFLQVLEPSYHWASCAFKQL